MQYLRFMPLVDVPAVIVVLAIFMLHFHWWANAFHEALSVDLKSRLPQAKIRLVLCFAGILLFCWLCDVSFCVILIMLLIAGAALSGLVVGDGVFVLLIGAMIREWVFGFPNLILSPEPHKNEPPVGLNHPWVGKIGLTSGPLKPTGLIIVDGEEIPSISEGHDFIEPNIEVQVTNVKNGKAIVRARETT